jgi:hypothetical protein
MTRSRPSSTVLERESANPLHFNLDPTPNSPTWVAALHHQVRNRGEQDSAGPWPVHVFTDGCWFVRLLWGGLTRDYVR